MAKDYNKIEYDEMATEKQRLQDEIADFETQRRALEEEVEVLNVGDLALRTYKPQRLTRVGR